MTRPIAISLSPNLEKDDVLLALKVLSAPWIWKDEKTVQRLEKEFLKLFPEGYFALAVNSGRSAEELILRANNIGNGDEVIVQGFTCVAVPNSVRWAGATPIYADVNENYNLSSSSVRDKVSDKTKAIIIQHSFGIPADVEAIKRVLPEGILVIEDCAVALGAKLQGKAVGTLGDIAFFSFGRDKVISSVFGGMILIKENKTYEKLKYLRDTLPKPGYGWVLQQLLHPVLMAFIVKTYTMGVGKVTLGKGFLVFSQKFGFLSRAVYQSEKSGGNPGFFPEKMSAALSKLALNQLLKLERFNSHRREIAEYYYSSLINTDLILPDKSPEAIWLRYPILHPKAVDLFNFLQKRKILVGDWYRKPIVPVNNLSKIGYRKGSCTNAEKMSKEILNLPTYPTLSLEDAKKVVELTKIWLNTQ